MTKYFAVTMLQHDIEDADCRCQRLQTNICTSLVICPQIITVRLYFSHKFIIV